MELLFATILAAAVMCITYVLLSETINNVLADIDPILENNHGLGE